MSLELWHVPVLVMAVIAIPVLVYEVIGRRMPEPTRSQVRTIGLALLSVIMLVLLVVAIRALGSSTAANIATMATAVIELVMLWLTYASYRDLRRFLDTNPDERPNPTEVRR
ncbi:MAG: hypothetical protein IRY85_16740 [Micromonosporaceae bacterium]|nr:hypothetical protein [Micromonosporaceae bacterium]